MKLFLKFPVTTIGLIAAAALVLLHSLFNCDIIQLQISLLDGIEKNEIDDLLVGFGIIFTAITVDRVLAERKRRRETQLSDAKLEALRSTMRTVQDIVNNFLNNMQYFHLEAEGKVSSDLLQEMEAAIKETADKINALSNLDNFTEVPLAIGKGVHFN